MREKLARLTAAGLVASSTFLGSGCELPRRDTSVRETPTIVRVPSGPPLRPEISNETRVRSEWYQLSLQERLRRLETRQYPLFSGFDEQQELTGVLSQGLCASLPCRESAVQLSSRVHIVSSSQTIDAYEKDNDVKLSAADRARTMRDFLMIPTIKDRQLFLNSEAIEERVRALSLVPQLRRDIGNRDFRTLAYESLMLEGISILSRSNKAEPVDIRIEDKGSGRVLTIDRVDELSLKGQFSDGTPYVLQGSAIAMAKYVAAQVSAKLGGYYLSFIPQHVEAGEMVRILNEKSGTYFSEFAEMYTGQQSIRELLDKWGTLSQTTAPSDEAALLALLAIGIHATAVTPPGFTRTQLEAIFGQKLF